MKNGGTSPAPSEKAAGRTYVLVDEYGYTCVMALDAPSSIRPEVEAGYWLAARNNVSPVDIELAEGPLREHLVFFVRQLLDAYGFEWENVRWWEPLFVAKSFSNRRN